MKAPNDGEPAQIQGAAEAAFHQAIKQMMNVPAWRGAPAVSLIRFDRTGARSWKGWGTAIRPACPVTRETVFRIASMSKSLLAATAAALQEDGLLDLRAPACALVPELDHLIGHDSLQKSITLEMLLANRSGLPEDNPWGDDHLDMPIPRLRALIERGGLRLAAAPGSGYQYSNIGQSFVGRAIERVTNRPVEQVVRSRLIEPLGLEHMWYGIDEMPAGLAESGRVAHGYLSFDGRRTWNEIPWIGHGALGCIGSIFSTPDDVARWAGFLADAWAPGERPDVASILSPAARRNLQRIHTVMSPSQTRDQGADLDGCGYGQGLIVEHHRRFGRLVHHSGGIPGFSSNMRWHAASGNGVAVFANMTGYPAATVAAHVLDSILAATGSAARLIAPWPETLDAAARIDAVIRAGAPFTELTDIIAPNVPRNEPLEVRQRKATSLIAKLGGIEPTQPPLVERLLAAESEAAVRWRIWCRSGTLMCLVRLSPVADTPVQDITIDEIGPNGRAVGQPEHPHDHFALDV